jgi:hypothetical protein
MRSRMRTFVFMTAVLGTALAGALVAGADHTTWTAAGNTLQGVQATHETIAGNPRCSVGTEVAKYEEHELGNGVFNVGSGKIIISNYDGQSFDWAIHPDSLNTIDANVIIVKGGPMAEVYTYPSAANGLNYYDDDQGLTASVNPNNGKRYGISHISFCFDPKA